MVKPRIMDENSLDAYDEGLKEGTIDKMCGIALDLVERYPDRTAKELLKIGHDEELYETLDSNLIKPRLDDLRTKHFKIIRPFRRECTETSKTAYVHRKYTGRHPKIFQMGKAPTVKYRYEHQGISDKDERHTTTYYSDGTIECTCIGFRTHGYCHGYIGMMIMIDKRISKRHFDYILRMIGKRNVVKWLNSLR